MGAVTVAWVAQAPEDDRGPEARALESWASAHGVELAPARDETPRAIVVDLRVADDVDALLDRARDAIAARDANGADAALAGAESMLRVHPELPQGAWLMAEVERTRSTRWIRVLPADTEAAGRAWTRAQALDGGRTTGIGEEAARTEPAVAAMTVHTVPDGAEAWLDGAAVGGATGVRTTAGPHLLQVVTRSRPAVLWARWLDLGAGPNTVDVSARGTTACSLADVSRAVLTGDAVDAQRVRCDDWIAVAPAESGSIRVARCGPGRCGPLLEWRPSPAWSWTPPRPEPEAHAWPAWATWSLVGAGAVVATGVVVVASGLLQPASTETRFVTNGIKVQ
jgi:hypothetical protein